MDRREPTYLFLLPGLWDMVVDRYRPAPVGALRKLGLHVAPVASITSYFTVSHAVSETSFVVALPTTKFTSKWSPTEAVLCKECGDTRRIKVEDGDCCVSCGTSMMYLHMVNTEPMSTYGTGGGRRATAYVYKRLNHFVDHLRRVQGKESASVRVEVINAVRHELARERIYDNDPRITTAKVRLILKKLKLQKHYVHVFLIASRLSGKVAPTMTPAQEEKLLQMFEALQEPFERHCPPDRTNMLSYCFILRKLCEILGWHELAAYFPLLKSRNKVYSQDQIWKLMCEDLGFPFIKSIA